ncbi:hypothetical protein [Aquimarina sediminis]|uniref:hypothetical protein n=1 Tax=Aquimarina sediminis TaxID=2070536 RepID=UPI000CA07A76|nr:hypothetical protein [Aquimarina sediminis]
MHENLRFNLKLEKLNDWQPVIATEYIGTFYMVYIRFISTIKEHSGGEHSAKCQFYLQNYRGPITFGLDHSKKDDFAAHKLSDDMFDYRLNIPISIFEKNPDPDQAKEFEGIPVVNLVFTSGLYEKNTIETEVIYRDPPSNIFNPHDLKNSKFLHPLYQFREGENIQHIHYKKYLKDGTSVAIRSKYDPKEGYGTIGSPTCDAKISEIIK